MLLRRLLLTIGYDALDRRRLKDEEQPALRPVTNQLQINIADVGELRSEDRNVIIFEVAQLI